MQTRPRLLLALPLLLVAVPGCVEAPNIALPAPYLDQGIRIEVLGTLRGPLGRYLGVVGDAWNETGRDLGPCELRLHGLDFAGEVLAAASAQREAWPAGEKWSFRALFPTGGLVELYDVAPGEVRVHTSGAGH